MAVAFATWCEDAGSGCIPGTWVGAQQCRGMPRDSRSVDLRFSMRWHRGLWKSCSHCGGLSMCYSVLLRVLCRDLPLPPAGSWAEPGAGHPPALSAGQCQGVTMRAPEKAWLPGQGWERSCNQGIAPWPLSKAAPVACSPPWE